MSARTCRLGECPPFELETRFGNLQMYRLIPVFASRSVSVDLVVIELTVIRHELDTPLEQLIRGLLAMVRQLSRTRPAPRLQLPLA